MAHVRSVWISISAAWLAGVFHSKETFVLLALHRESRLLRSVIRPWIHVAVAARASKDSSTARW